MFENLKQFWQNYAWSRERDQGRLFLLKELINWIVRIGLKLIPEHEPTGYGVAMWKYSLNRMENVARIELENGQDRNRDENFINLLQLLHRVGSYIGTKDPFYGLWLAFFFKQAQQAWLGCKESYLPRLRENLEAYKNRAEYQEFYQETLDTGFELRTCGGLFQIEQHEGDALNTLGRDPDG